jgi:acyl-CoA hydrolase/GNAT superfamily N-acetyltransferase
MESGDDVRWHAEIEEKYPGKFATEDQIFKHIHRGDHIFIGTGCGEPQYLIRALVRYVETNPKAFYDAEVLHVWTLGVAPYTDEKFKRNFRHNSFFVGTNTREAVNMGLADYTPISLSSVPKLIYRGLVPIDVALIQTSLPDSHGYISLGVSVDIVKVAVENAKLIIAQLNPRMPRVHGDTFLNIADVDFVVPHDEPLLEYEPQISDEIAHRIGRYVSRLIQDGDTIQVGYGSLPDAIIGNLANKRHLGVHTELLTEGITRLMKLGVIDNSRKSINRGKTVATFCMGKEDTYKYINDNPSIEFRTIDYTNDPLIIAQHEHMTAINSTLEIDLTGQASSESIGKMFYSGIGGQADFMRGAVLASNGKTILALQSTADNGERSRIVPFLSQGAGATLNRSDVHYVVTEYGIAYLHGKNIRERSMELISIAHPQYRAWLIQEAKKLNYIFKDQAYIPGRRGEYPEGLEMYRTTKHGHEIFMRPVRITDEHMLKDFFYSLTDQSLYRRFISTRTDMPHERLQEFVIIDYTKELVILAILSDEGKEEIAGVAQYGINEDMHTAEAAVVVRDDRQGRGIGSELISYLTFLAKKNGLLGFTAEVLSENKPVMRLIEKMNYDVEKRETDGMFKYKLGFRESYEKQS